MVNTEIEHTSLNEVQLSLLRLFNRPMSEAETLKLKQTLVDFYQKELNEEIEKVVREKKYSQDDYDHILNSTS